MSESPKDGESGGTSPEKAVPETTTSSESAAREPASSPEKAAPETTTVSENAAREAASSLEKAAPETAPAPEKATSEPIAASRSEASSSQAASPPPPPPVSAPGAQVTGERRQNYRRRGDVQGAGQMVQPEAPPPPPPPPPRKKKREGALSALSGLLSFLLLIGVGAAFAFIVVKHKLGEPGPLAADKVVYIPPRGEASESFAQQAISQLEREGVIKNPLLMEGALFVERAYGKLQSGEYLFKKGASLRDVIDILANGRQLLHAVTIPEGLTSEQIVQRLHENDVLSGDVNDIPKEGSLLPETYKAQRNFSRSKLLAKMQADQRKLVEQIWAKRAKDLPLKTPYELVTLASIVEKETGKPEERPHVASVFVNRLRKGMRLQSDPTIVYGLVGGKGSLGRGILRSEVERPTPYNTYAIEGLPPGPIANPGRAALEAAANPARTRDLYFVADGTGGHVFAESLEEHGRNVQKWRQIEREQKDKGSDEVDRVAPLPPPAPTAAPRDKRSDAGVYRIGRLLAADARLEDYAPGRLMSPEKGAPLRLARVPWVDVAAIYGVEEDATAWNAPAAKELRKARAFFTFPSAQPHIRIMMDGALLAGDPDAAGNSEAPPPEAEAGSDAAIAFISGEGLSTYPAPARMHAEQKVRAARLGLPPGSDEPPREAMADATADSAPPPQPRRSRAFDASENTPLDPLRDKSWDLSSAKSVPSTTNLR